MPNKGLRETRLAALETDRAPWLSRAKECTVILSLEFGIPVPTVQATLRQNISFASILHHSINLAHWALTEGSWEHITLHEFAHLVQYSPSRRTGRRIQPHGPEFRQALLDVAKAWYGDPKRHPWEKEHYPSTRSWAARQGLYSLSPQAIFMAARVQYNRTLSRYGEGSQQYYRALRTLELAEAKLKNITLDRTAWEG